MGLTLTLMMRMTWSSPSGAIAVDESQGVASQLSSLNNLFPQPQNPSVALGPTELLKARVLVGHGGAGPRLDVAHDAGGGHGGGGAAELVDGV